MPSEKNRGKLQGKIAWPVHAGKMVLLQKSIQNKVGYS
jgi:hypothetical protein